MRPSNIRKSDFSQPKKEKKISPPKAPPIKTVKNVKTSIIKGPKAAEKHLSKTKEKLTNLERLSVSMERASENLLRASEKFEKLQTRITDSTIDSVDAKEVRDKFDIVDEDCKQSAPMFKSESSRMRALSQGLQPGTTVVIKKGNKTAVILSKSAFNKKLRYEVRMKEDDDDSRWVDSEECEIAEPPYGWVVEWDDEYFEGTLKSGFVVGASWFRTEKKVEVELDKNETLWKHFEDVRFVSPTTGTKVAVVVDEGDDEGEPRGAKR